MQLYVHPVVVVYHLHTIDNLQCNVPKASPVERVHVPQTNFFVNMTNTQSYQYNEVEYIIL